jgi:hypothetical protein
MHERSGVARCPAARSDVKEGVSGWAQRAALVGEEMDNLLVVVALISLVAPMGVALGEGLVMAGMPLLFAIGLLDGPKGGKVDKSGR